MTFSSTLSPALLAISAMARPAIRRRVAGAWDDRYGAYHEGIPGDTPIRAVIHPLKGEEIAQLPQGEIASDHRRIWTAAELRVSDDEATSDIVIDEAGTPYRITLQGFRVEAGFTRCIGKRIYDRGRSV
jgi:hypothetical protein